MPTRKCHGTTKTGKPCGAIPLKPGTVIAGTTVTGQWCRQHDQDLPETARIGGRQPGAGRPRNPRAVDVLREKVEQNIDRVLQPLWDALEADKGIVVGNGPKAYLEQIPDHPTRLAATREFLDRVYGRPKSSSEITVINDELIEKALAAMEAEIAGLNPDD